MVVSAPPNQIVREAVRRVGGQVKFGRIIGCSQSNVSLLLKSGRPIPAESVLKVEAATGLSRYDLRPDVYPREEVPEATGPAYDGERP